MKVRIGDVSDLIRGVSYKKNDAREANLCENDILVLRGGNIQDGKIFRNQNDEVFVDKTLINEKQFLRKGDVVIVGSTGSSNLIGKAAIVENDFNNISFGAFLMLIRPRPIINSKYFDYYFLSAEYRNAIRDLSVGVNINNIRKEYIENLEINLPPLPEQRRIVAKLDAFFAHLEQVKQCMEQLPALLKQFREAVLMQAVTGKLTEEWRVGKELENACNLLQRELNNRKQFWIQAQTKSDRNSNLSKIISKYKEPFKPNKVEFELPNNWTPCTWDQMSNWITYGFTKPMPTVENGIPKVTVKNVRNGQIDFDSTDKTSEEAYLSLNEKDKPKQGDILITKDGATLGRSALIKVDLPFCIGQSVAVIWLRSLESSPQFLQLLIESKYIQDKIWDVARGMGMPHLSITDLRAITFGLPPKPEQTEIVRRVETLFSKADAIEAQYQKLKEQIDQLPQAILAKAFRGEI